jgi:hypothetical protein
LTFDVTSDDYKVITMTYNDSYARTNLVKFTIYDSNGNLMQTFEASSNNCTFTYDAYYTISDFASVEMLVSSASTTDTATKTWKIWLATYLDPANQTGIILPGANKPIIPAELLGINTGGVNTFSLSDSVANVLPVKVSADVLQIFACGIIMVICGLFSAQSSVKGTVIVSVIAALLYWMDFLHTNLWGTLAFAFVLAIFNVFAYASQTEGN